MRNRVQLSVFGLRWKRIFTLPNLIAAFRTIVIVGLIAWLVSLILSAHASAAPPSINVGSLQVSDVLTSGQTVASVQQLDAGGQLRDEHEAARVSPTPAIADRDRVCTGHWSRTALLDNYVRQGGRQG